MTVRLKQIRDARGYSHEDVARLVNQRFGRSYKWQTIQKWEKRASLKTEIVNMLATVLECGLEEIDDTLDRGRETVPIVGFVGAGAQVVNFEDAGELDRADAYGLPGTVALIVRGDSMWPAYYEGDLIYYHPRRLLPPDELLGRDAVVQVKDGPTLVKRIERGTKPGLFRLASHNAPPLEDQEILWASKILNVHKA